MGIATNTNIKHKMIYPSNNEQGNKNWDDITSEAKENTIIILDNIVGEDHYPEFDGYFAEKDLIPLHISVSWGLGGGHETSQIISIFTNPNSSLYLPTILVSVGLTKITDRVFSEVIKLIEKMKNHNKTRRPRVSYVDKYGKITTYEFPSFASIRDIKSGLKDIPNYSMGADKNNYFIRDIKNNRWIKET